MAVMVEWNGNRILKDIGKQSEKIVRCVALTISRDAKKRCRVKTSNLKRSIRAIVKKGKAEVRAGGDTGCAPRVTAPVGYAAYVELGTSKMVAKPYLVPAVESFLKSDMDNCIEKNKI